MRLFFALWPPPAAARALADWANAVARGTGGKAVTAERIHLTLAFLGEADPEKAVVGARQVQGEAFDLPIEVSQYWRHNQIVWAGPGRTPDALDRLVKALQLELYRAGFSLERRPFATHVTLLRKARTPPTLPRSPSSRLARKGVRPRAVAHFARGHDLRNSRELPFGRQPNMQVSLQATPSGGRLASPLLKA